MPSYLPRSYLPALQISAPDGSTVLLLSRGREYAVCAIHRGVVTARNYIAGGQGVLCGPCTETGLAELLHWTDHPTALQRFNDLSGRPSFLGHLQVVPTP